MPTLRCVLVVLVTGLLSLPAAALDYLVTEISPLPGQTFSVATGINAGGQVVGYSGTGNAYHAFLYTPATAGAPAELVDLQTLPNGSLSNATALNTAAEVVGMSDTQNAEPRGFLWRGGDIFDIVNGNGGANIHANDINDAGLIVGAMTNSGSGNPAKFRGILWAADPDQPDRWLETVLQPLPGGDPDLAFSYARSINASGLVVGDCFVSDGTSNHATLWLNDVAHTLVDLGNPPGGIASLAYGINDLGQVVGQGHFFGPQGHTDHAVRWENDAARTPIDLGTLPGYPSAVAVALNNHGHVVGTASAAYPDARAFIHRGGVMRDLNDLLDASGAGWTLIGATGINDAGQICGHGLRDGQPRAFLLTPNAGPTDVPAPRSILTDRLLPSAPNPFNPRTSVRFALARAGHVSLAVFDARGKRIATLLSGDFPAGEHAANWDGRDDCGRAASSGLYLVRLVTAAGVAHQQMTLAK